MKQVGEYQLYYLYLRFAEWEIFCGSLPYVSGNGEHRAESARAESYILLITNRKQAAAELCQAQFKLELAKTASPDVNIVFVFVFPVLKV
jgi:hypothetical protein